MATFRQIRANQHNAQSSTGPTSDAGKAASRRNSLKDGLTGEGVVLTDAQEAAVVGRMETWRGDYSIAGEQSEWLLRQVVVSSVRIDQCQADLSASRIELATRAASCWDDDRQLAAEELGARLATNPARVVGRLLRTVQGCQWLIDAWDVLGEALGPDDERPSWTEEHEARVLDLLGLAPEVRDPTRPPWATPDTPTRAALVIRELDRLERIRDEALAPLDEMERTAAELGRVVGATASSEPARAMDRLRRIETTSWKRFLWARTQLQRGVSRREAAPAPAPAPPPQPARKFGIESLPMGKKRTQCDIGQVGQAALDDEEFDELFDDRTAGQASICRPGHVATRPAG
jgi:hypothetical protein